MSIWVKKIKSRIANSVVLSQESQKWNSYYENMTIQIYWKLYHQKKKKKKKKKNENFQIKNSDSFHFHISVQNIDCGTRLNRLDEAVLTSTHNLCFWAEIRKIMYTLTPVLLYISGIYWGQNYIGMFSWWNRVDPDERARASTLFCKGLCIVVGMKGLSVNTEMPFSVRLCKCLLDAFLISQVQGFSYFIIQN